MDKDRNPLVPMITIMQTSDYTHLTSHFGVIGKLVYLVPNSPYLICQALIKNMAEQDNNPSLKGGKWLFIMFIG